MKLYIDLVSQNNINFRSKSRLPQSLISPWRFIIQGLDQNWLDGTLVKRYLIYPCLDKHWEDIFALGECLPKCIYYRGQYCGTAG